MDPRLPLVLGGWLFLIGGAVYVLQRRAMRQTVLARIEADLEPEPEAVPDTPLRRGLRRWLYVAGFRSPGAPGVFLLCLAGAVALGIFTAWAIRTLDLVSPMRVWAEGMPGGVGQLAVPILGVAPWILLIIASFVPILVVRSQRRKRVTAVERDLPLTLELLATLAEAGLGFDAGLTRVLAAQDPTRPLPSELHLFQAEVRTGMARTEAFRRLSKRLDVPGIALFCSAMIQAEQVGAGVASVLRRQADDQRQRRRELALIRAEALPVKLVFPLVICFLPGIFVITLGPTFHQFIGLADGMAGRR